MYYGVDYGKIIVSLFFTALGYGAVPLLSAVFRHREITKWKYRVICWASNLAIHVMLSVVGMAQGSSVAWCFWTLIWTAVGIKILRNNYTLKE